MPVSWKLLDMRARIRLIDTQLVILLARRFEIMREVRSYKQQEGLPLVDSRREQEVLDQCIDLAKTMGVPEHIVRELYEHLFEQVRGTRPETGLMNIKAKGIDGPENSRPSAGESGEIYWKR